MRNTTWRSTAFTNERRQKRAVLTRSAFEALQPHYGTVTFGETSHAAFPVDPFDLLDAHVPHYFNVSAILDLAGLFAYSPVADFEKPPIRHSIRPSIAP